MDEFFKRGSTTFLGAWLRFVLVYVAVVLAFNFLSWLGSLVNASGIVLLIFRLLGFFGLLLASWPFMAAAHTSRTHPRPVIVAGTLLIFASVAAISVWKIEVLYWLAPITSTISPALERAPLVYAVLFLLFGCCVSFVSWLDRSETGPAGSTDGPLGEISVNAGEEIGEAWGRRRSTADSDAGEAGLAPLSFD